MARDPVVRDGVLFISLAVYNGGGVIWIEAAGRDGEARFVLVTGTLQECSGIIVCQVDLPCSHMAEKACDEGNEDFERPLPSK